VRWLEWSEERLSPLSQSSPSITTIIITFSNKRSNLDTRHANARCDHEGNAEKRFPGGSQREKEKAQSQQQSVLLASWTCSVKLGSLEMTLWSAAHRMSHPILCCQTNFRTQEAAKFTSVPLMALWMKKRMACAFLKNRARRLMQPNQWKPSWPSARTVEPKTGTFLAIMTLVLF
jgi:hypothetical protein